MKTNLLFAISTGLIITSFTVPVSAGTMVNGWYCQGIAQTYPSPLSCSIEESRVDSFVNLQIRHYALPINRTSFTQIPMTIDCFRWQYTFENDGSGWRSASNKTIAHGNLIKYCL
jgi:hypothetical protein